MDYSAAYGELHANPKRFHGYSILDHVPDIAELVKSTSSKTLLDYGCGKGYQYLVTRVHEQWGGALPYCYDIGIPQMHDGKKAGPFDGVICTDMLEHIEEADVPTVLADIFSLSRKFVFLTVSCSPARHKTLPDGRNVHLTVKPPAWWDQVIGKFATCQFKVKYEDVPK